MIGKNSLQLNLTETTKPKFDLLSTKGNNMSVVQMVWPKNFDTKKVEAPKKTPTKKGPIGLQDKWGIYKQSLAKLVGNTRFVQLVPENSETIKAVKSKEILDAVYNKDKAFWVAAEKSDYRLAKSNGKVLIVYTFTPAGAKSLMQDYLICGSGDFDDDNEEKWSGEAQHPDYTIWKTNEIGAFGIGANRLAQLSSDCIDISIK